MQSQLLSSSGIITRRPPLMNLQALPNELLFNTAGRLSAKSLCSLSLVSKHLVAIAQVQLHLHPRIPSGMLSGKRSLFRLLCLDMTLDERPDLAAVVRSLELEPSFKSHYEGVGTDGEFYRDREINMAGRILRHTINLQQLDLTMLVDVDAATVKSHDPRAYLYKEIVCLFNKAGLHELDLHKDLSLIPGLKNLTTLALTSRTIEWAWCILPKLKKLHIGKSTLLSKYERRSEQSQVEDLSIERHTRLLCAPVTEDISMEHFLGGFPKLVKLVITLCNTFPNLDGGGFYQFISPRRPGPFECLIGIIDPVAPLLEHLVIKECNHLSCHSVRDYVRPVKSLTQFKRLKTLEVPYEVLFEDQHRPAATILPATLEKFMLHEPQLALFPVLEDLAKRPADLPNLQEMQLFLNNDRGLACEDAIYTPRKVWKKLWARDLRCIFWPRRIDTLPEWKDKDYDPFICVIVEFLESL